VSTNTGIEWTGATWNPVTGCTRKSPGCDHCYAVRMTYRQECIGNPKYAGLTVLNPKGERHFNGVVRCHDDALTIPFHWRKPQRIFVNSMSDLFHEGVPFQFIDKVSAVMALCPHHVFQVLTKRSDRMVEYLQLQTINERCWAWKSYGNLVAGDQPVNYAAPLPNVWLGVSVENREETRRIEDLRQVPAAVRFLSIEPLLEDVGQIDLDGIHWVIGGGESGPKARPMHPDWVRNIRDQCVAADVPFFFKQWGEWAPATREYGIVGSIMPDSGKTKSGTRASWIGFDGTLKYPSFHGLKEPIMAIARVGKKKAGRKLDGKIWDQFPLAETAVPA
jgi:protein gp37